MRFVAITRCRSCRSADLVPVVTLGDLASCGVFPRAEESDADAAPLALVQCTTCALVQLGHDYDGEDLYRGSYGYRSGINETMVAHLRGISRRVLGLVPMPTGTVVLDIGSNDGTLLKSYERAGVTLVGIDPTIERFKSYYPDSIATVADFFSKERFDSISPGRKASVVTSISMFYDLPDPNQFVQDIAAVLSSDGIWVLEQSYLPTMIERNSFDTICHEHLEYYCLHQVHDLCEHNGMRVLDVQFNEVNGGSFQVIAGVKGGPHIANQTQISAVLAKEKANGFLTPAPFKALMESVDRLKRQALDFLGEQARLGKVVHGYGASTKGNTLLQYFGIGKELLPVIADRNETKYGSRTPGTNIPIISEAASRADEPDYYFVLPWHFRDSFIQREQDFLTRGGRFVFPLPEFEIYGAR